MITRETISRNYIRGHGIDIGAFCNPFPVDYPTTIHYLDCKTVEEQKEILKDVDYSKVVKPHIIDDGEILSTIKDETYDFLCSSHQLEHCISPLTALENQLRIVKRGSYLFYAIPNKEKTFDKDRPTTHFEKLHRYYLRDIRNTHNHPTSLYNFYEDAKSTWNEMVLECYDEYLLNVDKIQDREERLKIGRDRMEKKLDIHFHTFTVDSTYDFFSRIRSQFGFEIELFYKNGHEIMVVIKKL